MGKRGGKESCDQREGNLRTVRDDADFGDSKKSPVKIMLLLTILMERT